MTQYTPRLPNDFIGGKAFSETAVWQELVKYNTNKGVTPPLAIRKAIDHQAVNLLDRAFLNPNLPLIFNGATFENMSALRRSWPPGKNYKSFMDAGQLYQNSLLEELVQKKVIRRLTEAEISGAVFSPLGFVDQSEEQDMSKLRMTYHWVMNSQCLKLPVDLARVEENGAALACLEEVYLIDLKSYYWQIPLDYASQLACSFAVPDEAGILRHYCYLVLPFGCRFLVG